MGGRMRHRLGAAAAAALTLAALASCAAPAAQPAGPPSAQPSLAAAPSGPASGDAGVAPTNEAAPNSSSPRTATPSRDPNALPIAATPRSTPNLGDAALLQPTTTLADLPASPVLRRGASGAKVYLIQQKFGIDETIQTLDSATMAKVRAFQDAHGLPATGEVDKATWNAMFPDIPWTTDRYRVEPALPLSAGANERIEAMIAYARAQKGAPYVWGSAGPKQYGFDCSGLLLQALYHAGLDPEPINVVDHAGDQKTATELYRYPGFKKVPVEQRRRGDFVFYGPDDGRITHVVLYLGDGYVLEALPPRGTSEDKFYESWFNHGRTYSMKPYAVRVTA